MVGNRKSQESKGIIEKKYEAHIQNTQDQTTQYDLIGCDFYQTPRKELNGLEEKMKYT